VIFAIYQFSWLMQSLGSAIVIVGQIGTHLYYRFW
jgi:hypothetical protein